MKLIYILFLSAMTKRKQSVKKKKKEEAFTPVRFGPLY